MSKFTDYEASYITPQKTLLKKFNEVLKFLRTYGNSGTKLYKHQITYENQQGNSYLINNCPYSLEDRDFSKLDKTFTINDETFVNLEVYIGGQGKAQKVVETEIVMQGEIETILFRYFYTGTLLMNQYTLTKQIITDTITEL